MRYILGVFGVIVLLLLIVILIVRGGSDEPVTNDQTGKKQVVLTDYQDKPAIFILNTRGEINADEAHRSVRISVSPSERSVEIIEGYNGNVTTRQTFSNNKNAYQVFLKAVDAAGFSREKETSIQDPTGVCPLGKLYDYILRDGAQQVMSTWNTSCTKKNGSFGGDGSTVRKLFEAQIPNYSDIVKGTKLT
jgi:hypothetical protein